MTPTQKEELIVNIMVWGFFALIFALILAGALWLASVSCGWNWKDSGRQYRWGPLIGCQVHDGKGFVPEKRIRVIE